MALQYHDDRAAVHVRDGDGRPDAVFVQSESSGYFHAESPRALARAEFLNERRLLALDLTYGVPVSALMYQYLLDNGMSRDEYEWFAATAREKSLATIDHGLARAPDSRV